MYNNNIEIYSPYNDQAHRQQWSAAELLSGGVQWSALLAADWGTKLDN